MADGRHLVKSIHLNISAMGRPISTKFCMVVHMGSPYRTVRHILQISEIQDGGGRHLQKPKISHISATDGPIWTKFGSLMQNESTKRKDH